MELCLISVAAISHVLGKTFVCFIGAAALYCACFLYEDEEGALQNRIEQLWIDIADKRKKGEQVPLAAKAAKIIGRMLDRVLGKRLLSMQMITMSLCLSWGIFYVVGIVGFARKPFNTEHLYQIVLGMILLLLDIASIAIILRWPRSPIIYCLLYSPVLFFLAYAIYFDLNYNNIFHKTYPWAAEALYVALIFSALSDLILTVLTRWSLRKVSEHATFGWLFIALIVHLITTTIIFIAPFIVFRQIRHRSLAVKFGAEGVVALNLFTIGVQLVFVIVIVFLQVHLLIWPAIERGVYALARFKIVTNRKALATISIACFAVVSPPFSEFLKKVSELFK